MHYSAGLSLLALLSTLASATPVPERTVRMPFTKRVEPFEESLTRRGAGKSLTVPLTNDVISYEININVGKPAQAVSLQLDSGSSDLWVLAPGACTGTACKCPVGGCTYYDPRLSKTAAYLNNKTTAFDFKYGSGEVGGFYITDGITVGGTDISSIIIGVATADKNENRGIMGVGLPEGENNAIKTHPGVIGALKTQGTISSNSYSLYLDRIDAAKGEVIFGGIDSSKYSGSLVPLPIVASPDKQARLTVQWASFAISSGTSTVYDSAQYKTSLSTNSAVLLDSGTTLSYISPDLFTTMIKPFGLVLSAGSYYTPCATGKGNQSLKFRFGAKSEATIVVPASQLIRQKDTFTSNGVQYCGFGVQPGAAGAVNILGDTFLSSAYVYYNFDDRTISLAQAKWSA